MNCHSNNLHGKAMGNPLTRLITPNLCTNQRLTYIHDCGEGEDPRYWLLQGRPRIDYGEQMARVTYKGQKRVAVENPQVC